METRDSKGRDDRIPERFADFRGSLGDKKTSIGRVTTYLGLLASVHSRSEWICPAISISGDRDFCILWVVNMDIQARSIYHAPHRAIDSEAQLCQYVDL